MASIFTKVVANFSTTLVSNIGVGDNAAQIASNLTKDGVAIPDGRYCFTVNQGKSNEMHFLCNVVGTNLSNIETVDRLGVVTPGAVKVAQINDEIKITDFVNLKYLVDDVDALNAIVAGIIVSGAPDATDTSKGVVRLTASPNKTLGNPTISIASPAVVTLNNHGLIAGDTIRFSTGGTLPTGIIPGVTYFVIATGLTINTFQLSLTAGGTAVNTSGTQGGTHTLVRLTPMAVSDNDSRIPSPDTAAALLGSRPTPNANNKFVTERHILSAIVDQSQLTQNSTQPFGRANSTGEKKGLAQSFIAQHQKIRGVTLYKAANTGTFTGDLTIYLKGDNAGSPGSSITSIVISNADYSRLAVGAFDVIFSAEQNLTPGTKYWIEIAASTSDNSNYGNLGVNSAGGYTDGEAKYWNVTDGWVSIPTIDFYFRTLRGAGEMIVQADSNGEIPVFLRRLKSSSGYFSKTMNEASVLQTIPHGLGVKPSKISFTWNISDGNSPNFKVIKGVWEGNNVQKCIYWQNFSGSGEFYQYGTNTHALFEAARYDNSYRQEGYVTADDTNIYIQWTKVGSIGATQNVCLWEAEV